MVVRRLRLRRPRGLQRYRYRPACERGANDELRPRRSAALLCVVWVVGTQTEAPQFPRRPSPPGQSHRHDHPNPPPRYRRRRRPRRRRGERRLHGHVRRIPPPAGVCHRSHLVRYRQAVRGIQGQPGRAGGRTGDSVPIVPRRRRTGIRPQHYGTAECGRGGLLRSVVGIGGGIWEPRGHGGGTHTHDHRRFHRARGCSGWRGQD
mmetsp:Transcript_15985/g.45873  ORF Transcript_15985/g.45873 Transcript_15985/m.45873 type:complete len:205 (+) Transcript_15985:604-1218(+)